MKLIRYLSLIALTGIFAAVSIQTGAKTDIQPSTAQTDSLSEDMFRSSVNSQTGIVSISGHFSEMPNTVFAVYVYQADVDNTDGVTTDTLSDYFNHVEQVYTDEEGVLNLSYEISGKTGKYKVFAVSADSTVCKEHYFVYIDNLQGYIDEIEICRSTKPADAAIRIKAVLENEFLRNAMGIYDDQIPGGMTFSGLNEEMFAIMAKASKPYKTADDVCIGFAEAAVLYLLQNSSNDEVGRILSEHKNLLAQTDENILCLYWEIKETNEDLYKKINEAVIEYKAENISQLCGAVTEATVLQSVRSMNNYTELMPFIEKINNAIGLDLEAYARIKSPHRPENVDKAIVKSKDLYKTINELKEEFSAQITAELNRSYERENTGGGSSKRGYTSSLNVQEPISGAPLKKTDIFIDLNGYEWCRDAAEKLSELGIVSGDGNGLYRPSDFVTRAELLKVMLECFDVYDDTAETNFSDVHKGDWFYGYVATGHKLGFVKGMGDGLFGVEQPVTRQDMAVMVYNIASANGVGFSNFDFGDALDFDEVSDYAADAVAALMKNKLAVGNGDGKFRPHSFFTRAEMAVVICRLLEL